MFKYGLTRVGAVGRCYQLSRLGMDWRSQRILFYVGILAEIWPARRKILMRHMNGYLEKNAVDGLVEVTLRKNSGGRQQARKVVFRYGDRADYQTLWECFQSGIYVCPEPDVHHLLDGGANIGFFTVAAELKIPIRDVVALEPDQDNLRLLRRNLGYLGENVVVPAALDGKEGEVWFEKAESNTGHLRDAPAHVGATGSYRVSCKRLSEVIPAHWSMAHTWLKLDIEGAEYAVVRDLLADGRRPKVISMEIHKYPTAGGAQLVEELRGAGYTTHILDAEADNSCRQLTALYQGESA